MLISCPYLGKSTVFLREHYAKQKKSEGAPVWGHKVLRLVDNHLYTYRVSLVPPANNVDRNAQNMATVMKLLEYYLDMGRIFIFDNLFISIDIAETMRKRNSYVVGPIRRKCRGTPEKFKGLKLQENEVSTDGERPRELKSSRGFRSEDSRAKTALVFINGNLTIREVASWARAAVTRLLHWTPIKSKVSV